MSKYRGGEAIRMPGNWDTSRKWGLILKNNAKAPGDELKTEGPRGLTCLGTLPGLLATNLSSELDELYS